MVEQVENIPLQSAFPEQIPNRTPKNLLKAVFFVVFVLMLAGAVYAGIQIGKKQTPKTPSEILFNQPTIQATPTIDQTEGWNVYTNSVIGYQLKYPKNWKMEEDAYGSKTVWFFPDIEENNDGAIPSYLISIGNYYDYIDKANNAEDLYLAEIKNIESRGAMHSLSGEYLIEKGEFAVGELRGFQIITKLFPPKPSRKEKAFSRNVYLLGIGKAVGISYGEWMSDEEWEQQLEKKEYWPKYGRVVDQILSTFKFLE